jgi:RHS repeat-associated protein
MTDTSGALVWRAEHTPFGGIYALTVGTTANNLRFPGQYFDGETGLAQNWFRDYKHNTGRYWEPDPLALHLLQTGTGPSVFVYAYAYNSPLSIVDPLGLKGCCKKCPSGKWNYTAGPLSFTFVIGVGGISSRGVLKCKDDPWNNRVPVKIDCRGGGLMAAVSWDVLGGSLGDAVSGIKDSCDIPAQATDRIIAGSWPMPPFGWSRSVWGGPFSLTLSPGIGGGFGVFSCTTTRRD